MLGYMSKSPYLGTIKRESVSLSKLKTNKNGIN